MINNIKLIRARLSRNGIKGISNATIKEAILQHTDGSEEFTDEQKDAVVNELIQAYQSGNVAIEKTEEAPINTFEGEIDYEALASLPKVEGAITPSQKREMVASQAQLMGLSLAESDIQNIAQQVDFQTSDSEELIDEIKGFLVAFIQFRANQNRVKINNALAEVITFSNQTNREVSEELSTGLKQFAVQMEEQRNHFKSSVRSALRHLALPSTEA